MIRFLLTRIDRMCMRTFKFSSIYNFSRSCSIDPKFDNKSLLPIGIILIKICSSAFRGFSVQKTKPGSHANILTHKHTQGREFPIVHSLFCKSSGSLVPIIIELEANRRL